MSQIFRNIRKPTFKAFSVGKFFVQNDYNSLPFIPVFSNQYDSFTRNTSSSFMSKSFTKSENKIIKSYLNKMIYYDSKKNIFVFDDNKILNSIMHDPQIAINEFQTEKLKLLKFIITTTRGRILEKYTIPAVNKIKNTNFVSNKQTITLDLGLFNIRGRADGIDINNGQIIEVKTRGYQSDQIDTLSMLKYELHEKIQVMFYMKMFNINRVLLTEVISDLDLKFKDIIWDQDEFDHIVAELNKMCYLWNNRNTMNQTNLIKLDNQKDYYQQFKYFLSAF